MCCNIVNNPVYVSRKGRGIPSLLHFVGILSFLQGIIYLIMSYIDNTIAVLPQDPLTIIGIVSMEAGVIFFTMGLLLNWYKGFTCKKSTCTCQLYTKRDETNNSPEVSEPEEILNETKEDTDITEEKKEK